MLLRALTWKREGLLPLPAAEEVVLPKCGGTEHVTLRVRKPRRGDRLRSVRVTVNGKRVKVSQKAAVRKRLVRLALARQADGRFVVKVVARTKRKKLLRSTRTFTTCPSRAVASKRTTTASAGAERPASTRPLFAPRAPQPGERDPITGEVAR
jgi:hypothetical protein